MNFRKTVQICGVAATCVLRNEKSKYLPYLYFRCVIMSVLEGNMVEMKNQIRDFVVMTVVLALSFGLTISIQNFLDTEAIAPREIDHDGIRQVPVAIEHIRKAHGNLGLSLYNSCGLLTTCVIST